MRTGGEFETCAVNTPQQFNSKPIQRDALLAMRDQLAALPLKDPREALIGCFGRALENLTEVQIQRLRERIVAHFGEAHEFIELVDGHRALREIRNGN